MPRKALDEELGKIRRDILEMTELAATAVKKAVEAVEKNDKKLAEEVKIEDCLINEYENQIKSRCIRTIALQQPVAKDLRGISVSIEVAYNIERIGDFATDIATSIQYMNGEYAILDDIKEMGQICATMVETAGDAFVNEKKSKFDAIFSMEDRVDELYKQTFPILEETVKKGEKNCETALNLILIAKFLERIADHSVNIVNRGLYQIYGKDEYL